MIARKSMLIVIAQFSTQIIGWIGMVLMAKLWGDFAPQVLGSIGFAMSFLALFNLIADLGFGSAHVKRISEGKDLGACIGTYAAIKIVLNIVVATFVFTSIFLMKNIFQIGFEDATSESMIYIFLVYYMFSNLSTIAIFTFSGTREIAKREIPAVFGRIAKVVLVVIVTLAGVSIIGVANISPAVDWPELLYPIQQFLAKHATTAYAATYLVDMTIIFLVGIWILRRYPIKKPDWILFKSYFTFAFPIMFLSAIYIISTNIDKVMIGYYWTSTEVGYYFAVQRITAMITILYVAVGSLLFPTFSEYNTKKQNMKKIRSTAHISERYISMIMIPPLFAIIIFASPLILIMLDKAFLPAAPVLIVLTIYVFIHSMNEPYSCMISGMNRPGILAKVGLVICSLNIGLNLLFIPQNGLLSHVSIGPYFISLSGPTGAAIATLVSTLAGFFCFRFIAKKIAGTKIFQNHTPRHILAGIVMGIVLYYIGQWIVIIRFYHLLMFAGIGIGIYISVLFLLKEFDKKDLNFFLDILNIKEMASYIKSELTGEKKK